MKNLQLPKSQGGAVLSIEFILLAIVGVASAIIAMVAALDILPVLQDYLHSWVTDFAQSTETALRNFCMAEMMTPHKVNGNDIAEAGKATSMQDASLNIHFGSLGCAQETAPNGAGFMIDVAAP